MNVDRLQALLQVLEGVQKRDLEQPDHPHFNINAWMFNPHKLNYDFDCNTVACAFGWMCLSERGKADGLSMRGGMPIYVHQVAEEVYINYEYDAAEKYFDIPHATTSRLFHPGHYEHIDPELRLAEVINRVKNLIDQGA